MDTHVVKPTVLVVDDEPVSLALVEGILEEDYRLLAGAQSGREALARIAGQAPDLVITDIVMPEMNGYELCQAIRDLPAGRDIPVLFLSGQVELEEYLAGHDAGGEDFLAKPFDPAELRHKVARSLRNVQARKQLAQDAQSAFSTAMVAMTSAAEMGQVMQFIRGSFACRDYGELADAMVAACGEYGLSACVRLNGRVGMVHRNRQGNSSPLEQGILARMAEFGRIVDFRHRTAINYPHVTLMITDMPTGEPERYGRLRDHLMVLAESADARIRSLDDHLEAESGQRALANLVAQAQTALADINHRHRQQQNDARMILHRMHDVLESSYAQLTLTTAQEEFLAGTVHATVQQIMDLFDQGLAIDNHLSSVKAMLAGATPAAANA